MRIYHNKTFNCYEDCEQDINAFGKEIFLDGHKLYTKADLVAMLTEIQLEIEELETGGDVLELGIKDDCKDIIQQKIDKCKTESEEE